MSNMNQSCWAIKNSRTFWLRACSLGDISCSGCEMMPGRNMTARLVAVMRFFSHFLANTDRRSRTYKRRYWFGRGMRRMRDLYVAMTCS